MVQTIQQIERTCFPEDFRDIEKGHPIEDMFGEKITTTDIYFIMRNGDVVHEVNIGEYQVRFYGAIEKQAK